MLCPITELGFLRISTGVLNADMADARVWDGQAAPNSKATTGFYLAHFADTHGLKLATFDTGIKHPADEAIA